jgi:hypothetical protein
MLFGCLIAPCAAGAADFELSIEQLEASGPILGYEARDFDEDGLTDLLCAHLSEGQKRDADGRLERSLSLFLQRKTPQGGRFATRPDARLRVGFDASMFATGNFLAKGGSEVALLSRTGIELHRLGEDSTGFVKVATIAPGEPGFFDFPVDGGLFRWTLTRDLDGDGRRDLLFPQKSGYELFSQRGEGAFSSHGKIRVPSRERFGPPMETQFLNRFLTYLSSLSRVVPVDINNDGLLDLVAYRKKGLASFLQKQDGTFPLDPDREAPLEVVKKAGKTKDGTANKDVFSNVKLALRDLDGDGRVDLVATKTVGEIGVFETLRTQVLIFLGGESGIDDSKPNRILNLKGVTLEPEFTDINGDRDMDLVLSSLRMDMFSNVKRALLDSVSTTYTVYLYRGGQRVYSKKADFERSAETSVETIEQQGQVRLSWFSGDFDGDGLKDMLTITGPGELTIVPARVKTSFFSGRYLSLDDDAAKALNIKASTDLAITDLDGDGRDEVVLRYPKADDPDRARLRVIRSRSRK